MGVQSNIFKLANRTVSPENSACSNLCAGGSYRDFFDWPPEFEIEDVCEGLAEGRHSQQFLDLQHRNRDVVALERNLARRDFEVRDCLTSRFGAGGSYRQFFDSLIKFENEDVCDGIAEVRHSRKILHA